VKKKGARRELDRAGIILVVLAALSSLALMREKGKKKRGGGKKGGVGTAFRGLSRAELAA